MSTNWSYTEPSAHFIRGKWILKAADTAKYNARLKEIDLPDDYASTVTNHPRAEFQLHTGCVNKVLDNARNAINPIWRMRLPACRNPS